MIFYKLTDRIRNGDVIRAEGRKHYTYSFGPCQWVRTTVMMAYMNPDSALYGKYEEVTEEEARQLVLAKGSLLARLLPRAEALAEQYHAGQTDKAGKPYIEHPRAVAAQLDDLEQKITGWLHDLCEDTPVTPRQLLDEGFTPRIVQAVRVLTKPGDMDYYDYIRRVRMDPIARAVKLADLNHNMDLSRLPVVTDKDRARAAKYEKCSAFLNMEGELPDKEPAQAVFVPAMEVFRAVSRDALEGKKLPHGVSHPVLRREDGTLYLAFFVYLYQKKHLDANEMPRPALWLLADLTTGQIVRRHTCVRRDFSQQPRDLVCSMDYPERPADSAGRCAALYERLDGLRMACARGGEPDRDAYGVYLDGILELTPPAYRVFYRELSAL